MPMKRAWISAAALAAALGARLGLPSAALADAEVNCTMTFDLDGWSIFFQTASGAGLVKCDNGQTARVRISARGGGLTFGKRSMRDAVGTFTPVKSLDEVLGSYARIEAHAGAGESASAQTLTRGDVSLSISGTGRGIDLGIAAGNFTIEEVE